MEDTKPKSTPIRFLSSLLMISLLISSSSAQNCQSTTFSGNRIYSTCTALPVLNSFLHWNYHQSNRTVDLAYRHTGVSSTNWVAWALNINGVGMAGAQALVAFQGTGGNMQAYTSSVIDTRISTLSPGNLSFGVPSISAEFVSSEIIIYATLQLPGDGTSFNQVWQIGPLSGNNPAAHNLAGANVASTGTVNFADGSVTGDGGAASTRQKNKNIHGVLNAISWGVLMPFGAIVARYLKVFKSADPAWFYIHVACQSSAYIIGVAGLGTGLKLGEESGLDNTTHRNIGITLFCLGTLQVFALMLRPNKDNKYRMYWNFYHWGVGYAVIILTIVNIFKGFELLNPAKGWKHAYIGIIISYGAIAVLLECYTWYFVIKRKRQTPPSGDKYPYAGNGQAV
ncbi:cytochrome b561 and DOMON domain-containing protein At5g47530-like [Impatiens glandulifera]|uniref:cytochrome b561 and DOMON domain-containing protein At5g47530-like n=1 Tax=Impatiens glandulifera TaxID=253017 RepID=UPI001FB16DB3|nr:cytochrome b561 and DOMON domain-containing protein At5g47530-like [Impatiens glandulifera]